MVIENRQQDHQIRELTCGKEAGNIRLHWRYKEASDFLIFIYDSRQEFQLEAALEEIAAAGLDDADILDHTKKLQAVGKNGSGKLVHLKKAEFVRAGRCFLLPVNELKKDVPYGISVFACMFDGERGELRVYPSDVQENTCFLPVKLKVQIRYHTRLFSREKYCMLRVPRMDDYRDGAILYHVEGEDFDVPLPQTCLGRELVIVIPRHAKVSVRVREADKKYVTVQTSAER